MLRITSYLKFFKKIRYLFYYRTISKFILAIGILTLFFCIYSAIVICITDNLTYLGTSEGFKNLFNIFEVPIKSFAAFIALITVYVTLERADLNRHNINMNNYYKHLEEFGRMMNEFQKEVLSEKKSHTKLLVSIMDDLNSLDIRRLYSHWYGKQFDSKHMILKENIKSVKRYYSMILSFENYDDLSKANFGEFGKILSDLGFNSIINKINIKKDYLDYYEHSFVEIIERILDFSNETIINDQNFSLGISVQKHLYKLDKTKK